MPNWVYNRLTVTGEAKNLKLLAETISSKGKPIDFPKLAGIVPRTWDTRDERPDTRVEKMKGGLIYFFDTAWSSRPNLIRDLAKVFPQLHFELYFSEEMEQFAGALICKDGKQFGEAYLGEEELEDFMVSSDEWNDEEELDKEALEQELLKQVRAGSAVDWEARKAKLELLRADAETATLTRIRSRLQELTSNPKLYPPKKKATDEALCQAIRGFESDISFNKYANFELVPEIYLSEWVALQLCMTNASNWEALPNSVQTQSFWNKYIKCKETLSVYYNPELKRVPARFRSDSLIRYALKQDYQALEALKPAERTAERCKIAVQRNSSQLKLVPQALRNAVLCRIAINSDGMSLQFVPEKLRSPDLCELATYKGKRYNAMAIQFVPRKLITRKMFEFFIQSPRGKAYEDSLEPEWIPERFRTFELIKELLPTQPKLLSIIKPKMLERLWRIEGYPMRLVKASGWQFNWFEHIPESVRSHELYQYVIQNHGVKYYKSLPEQFKTKVLSLEAFYAQGVEILPHVPQAIFDREFCSVLLQSEVTLYTWKLNCGPDDLSEFVNSIPAVHLPKHVWSPDLVEMARTQTKFSELAFPEEWIQYDKLEEVVLEDKNLFFYFDKEIQTKFESQFEALSGIADMMNPLQKLAELAKWNPEIEQRLSTGLAEILKLAESLKGSGSEPKDT